MTSFIAPIFACRKPPTSLARRSSNGGRRPGSQRRRPNKARPPARLDPILDDGDIDTTDITTYFSCPTCFTSIMLRPGQLVKGPLQVRCNCCEKKVMAKLSMLENIDGSPFDDIAWRQESGIEAADSGGEDAEGGVMEEGG